MSTTYPNYSNIWKATIQVFAGSILILSDGRRVVAVLSGITGVKEPDWPNYVGGCISDGTIMWMCQYKSPEPIEPIEVDWNIPTFDLNGNPISQSIQAKEAKPEYEPPLWEERDI